MDGIRKGTLRRRITSSLSRSVFSLINKDEPVINYDTFQYQDAYRTTGAVYECVDLITKKVVASPIIVYLVKNPEGYKKYLNLSKSENIADRAHAMKLRTQVLEEVHVPAIQELLEQPNEVQTGSRFIEILAASYLLRGNAYVYGNPADRGSNKWVELFAMHADMQIVGGGGRFEPVKEYFVTGEDRVRYPAKQILHLKTFNPSLDYREQLYGMSPLAPYLYSIDKILYSDKQALKQLNNGGKMGFISPKMKEDELGQEQKDILKQTIQEAYDSSDALSRLIPASIPLAWTEIGLSSQDMELLGHTNVSADDIYRGYHVPLYFRTLDSSTYNNVVTAKKAFIYDAVAPIAEKIAAGLTDFICAYYRREKKKYVIAFDYMSLPELSDDVKSIMEYLERADMLTPNEKREMMGFGKSDAAGMDEIFISKNKVRLQDIMDGKINQGYGNTAGVSDNEAQNEGTTA